MLVVAVVIIVQAPKCPPPAPKQWWQKAPIYQAYVKSFKDSNGDGIGDLKGVESKLDYLADLGVGTVALSPVFKSGNKDNGYDITDFTNIDSQYGSLQDFKELLAGMHERNIKMIIDFVPNHSSDQHEWFQKSVKKEAPYTDFYVWQDGKNGGPPNNWKSVFGGSAWTLNAERGQYYLHQFYKEQPDLNLKNPEVVKRMKDVLKFWLDLGVDGFRVDSVAHFFENMEAGDEGAGSGSGDAYDSVDHKHTFDLPESVQLLKEFRAVLDEKTKEDEYNPRVMMTEAYLAVEDMGKYYGEIDEQIGDVSHMPLNFGLIEKFDSEESATAQKVYQAVTEYMDGLPMEVEDLESNLVKTNHTALKGAWSNFNTGNHDNSRMASRFGPKLMDAINMIVMLLQGTPVTYYGDEIGMVDGEGGADSRTTYGTPMLWSPEHLAGFSSVDPWTKLNYPHSQTNVKVESEAKASHLKVFRQLAAFRHHDAVLFGETEFKKEGDVFGFTRIKKGNPGLLVLVNFGDKAVDFDGQIFGQVPEKGNLEVIASAFDTGDIVRTMKMNLLTLQPKEGRVFTFVPK